MVLVVVVVVIVYTSRRTATIATSAATLASEVMMNGDFNLNLYFELGWFVFF